MRFNMLRWRHLPQLQAVGETKEGQEADERDRQGQQQKALMEVLKAGD